MRAGHLVSALGVLLAVELSVACGGSGGAPRPDVAGEGGSRNAGGAAGHAGTELPGGTAGSGGSPAGGTMSSGGSVTAGGAPGSGGSSGGSSAGGTTSSGGSVTAGGAPGSGGSSGGNPSSGGFVSTGGAAATGGSMVGSGGTIAAGGSTSLGGTAGEAGSAGAPSHCSLPTRATSAKALAAYGTFRQTVVTANGAGGFLRVYKPDSGTVTGSTVSEGMGYGMLLAVYHDDQPTFDALWQYVGRYLNGHGLMDWEVDPQGNVIGTGAASDGDEDIAFALIMAARRWGGRGSLAEDYLVLGSRMVNAMWTYEVDRTRGNMWKPGDAWGDRDVTNLSYFAPAYFRVFGEATGNVDGWNQVIDGNYTILARTLNATLGNANNGLVPAWSNSLGQTVSAFDGAPTHFQNDSTRTPFRIGQDWCWFGEPRAKTYLDKIAGFYQGVGVANITDGYNLDGTPHPERPGAGMQAASFVGPAGVAFMSDPKYALELDQAWDAVATEQLTNGTIYYQKSWTALSLVMMAGDMLVYPPLP